MPAAQMGSYVKSYHRRLTVYELENGSISITFSDNGMISSLMGPQRYEFIEVPGLWRIIYQAGDEQEIELTCSVLDCIKIKPEKNQIEIVHESELVKVTVNAILLDDSVKFDAEIECKADILIREFQLPCFCMGPLNDFSLIRSSFGGAKFKSLYDAISASHTGYMALDNKAVTMNEVYPGEAATNCFSLLSNKCGIYFGSHDPTFQVTLHHLRSTYDGISALLVKYPFLTKGEKAKIEGFTVAPFNGDWHQAADIYRHWAESWYMPPTPPAWIRTFHGWQRLIMKHQYGTRYFHYSDLPEMLRDGQGCGIDCLLLFGWWAGGMDGDYPNYIADPELGGETGLKAGIKTVGDQGGKTLLYFNGQLIDHDSRFYKDIGKDISVKLERGDDHTEVYSFAGEGTSLRQFGNRVFSTGCFSCSEWVEVLRSCIDKAADFGVDGVFFDQLGMKLWPCFDASHGHPVPDMRGFDTKARVVEQLRIYTKEKYPAMAFGTEMVSDRLSPHVDFFHTVNCGYGRNWRGGEAFIEWFRYMFPEVIVSDREIRDEKCDFQNRVNHAVQMGLKTDVEIYRCRATIAETPKYGAWLKDANGLRKEFSDFVAFGTYLDDVPVTCSNPEIRMKAYAYEDKLLLFAAQRHEDTLSGTITVAGYEYDYHKGLGEFQLDSRDSGLVLQLSANALVAIVLEKMN